MPLARLLLAAMLLSGLAMAQGTPASKAKTSPAVPDFRTNAATSSEPWRIIPTEQTKSDRPKADLEAKAFVVRPGGAITTPSTEARTFVISPADLEGDDNTCYAIRSYVVARDSKDSESTHPVGYSTCQKASRYHVKKVETAPTPDRP